MKTFRFGIMGAGHIAEKFCDAVSRVEGAEVTVVSSKDKDRAMAFAEKNKIPSYCGSYDEMLSSDDIDAVYIATTHNFHYDNLLDCIGHSKPVICEKPMALKKEQAETAFAKAVEKRLFVMEAMWSRFLPNINKARQWVRDGRIGRIDMASAAIGFVADDDPENRLYNPELAGGAMYDIGVYAIELMSYLIGKEVRRVSSTMLFTGTGVDKVDSITLEFDGCIASLQSAISATVPDNIYLYGTKGYIKIPSILSGDSCCLYGPDCSFVEEFRQKFDNGFVYEVEEVIRCVRAGRLESDIMPHKDTIRCAEIFEECLESAKNN